MASWSFRSTKASWLLRNLRPKRLEEPMASWSFRSTKASWLLSSLKEPMASWRFFCKRSTKASWLPEAETSRGAHGILDPKPFKAFNVRQTFSKNFQKLDPVLHALCGRCHCRWTSTHICTRIWGAVIGARAFAQRLRRSRGFGRGLLSVLLPPQSPLLPLTASLLLLLLFPILSGFPPGVCTLVLGITPALVQLASWVKAAASLIVSYDSTFLAEPQVQHLMFRWRLPDELLLLGLLLIIDVDDRAISSCSQGSKATLKRKGSHTTSCTAGLHRQPPPAGASAVPSPGRC